MVSDIQGSHFSLWCHTHGHRSPSGCLLQASCNELAPGIGSGNTVDLIPQSCLPIRTTWGAFPTPRLPLCRPKTPIFPGGTRGELRTYNLPRSWMCSGHSGAGGEAGRAEASLMQIPAVPLVLLILQVLWCGHQLASLSASLSLPSCARCTSSHLAWALG